jgi:hypothetical protein
MLEQLVEIEQSEKKGCIGDEQPGNEVVSGQRSHEADQERVEGEKGHVGALVALRRDIQVMHRVPASPDREQHVRGFLNVRAGALSDDHRRQLGDDDDRDTGGAEIDQNLSDGLVEARGDQHLADAEQRDREEKEPRAVR